MEQDAHEVMVLFPIKDEVIDALLILVDAPFVSLCLCLRVRKKAAVCVFPSRHFDSGWTCQTTSKCQLRLAMECQFRSSHLCTHKWTQLGTHIGKLALVLSYCEWPKNLHS